MSYHINTAEWERFWRWVGANTGAHHIGPGVTVTGTINPRLEEISMNFFLTYKDTILNNPPICTCGNNVFVGNHKNKCPKERFHRLALNVRT